MRRNKAAHVLSLVAQCHGGRLYDSAWSKRMVGYGPYAEMLARALRPRLPPARLRRRARPSRSTPSRFRPPPQQGDQLALF